MKQCDFCHAIEGKRRPIGRFIVKLKPVKISGVNKLACQSCFHKEKTIIKARRKKQGLINREAEKNISLKNLISTVFT